MRALRLVIATLLVAAGIAIGAPSAYADDDASFAVSPRQGRPDAEFTATLRWRASKHGKTRLCQPAQIAFEWDGSVLGGATPVQRGDSCVATLHATPPAGTYQRISAHTISISGVRGVRATYAVLPGSPAAPATPEASAEAATPDSTETATAEAQTNSPAGPAAAGTGNSTGRAAGAQTSGLSGLTALIIAFGTALFIAGAGALGLMAWRGRRAKAEAGAPPPEAAALPAEAATQQLPIPRQFGRQEDPQTVQLPPAPGN